MNQPILKVSNNYLKGSYYITVIRNIRVIISKNVAVHKILGAIKINISMFM